MKVNLCANRFTSITNNWKVAYDHICDSFDSLGFDVHKSKLLNYDREYPLIESDSSDYIYLYNHLTLDELIRTGFHLGYRNIIMKPTGPSPKHFTLDTIGYACASSITYIKPDFESIDLKETSEYFDKEINKYKQQRIHKWSDSKEVEFTEEKLDLPKDHILILGQMPGDETVSGFSFGSHWKKLQDIVSSCIDLGDIVVKLHPSLITETSKEDNKQKGNGWDWDFYYQTVKAWQSKGVVVLYQQESLHDVLQDTRVAIVENSTAGIDCMMYDIPLISYGYPEYHWITKDLRHLIQLRDAIEDISWFDKNLARKWLTWYCKYYQCFDYESTKKRIVNIIENNF